MNNPSLIIKGSKFLLFKNDEKLVALLVYSSFIRIATGGLWMNPYSLVVVVVCAQERSESRIGPYSLEHCSTV